MIVLNGKAYIYGGDVLEFIRSQDGRDALDNDFAGLSGKFKEQKIS
ncbi:MAG: hypothetical protein PHR06_15810 [Candidatus Cloacimonetes bacterium]|nr:hypothetical protein [Candidatus Cloacimonadota bacterium]